MAELLEENPDTWTAFAGRIPGDLQKIIQKQPAKLTELLREAAPLTAEQLGALIEQVKKMKKKL
jgi:hypothetical protein